MIDQMRSVFELSMKALVLPFLDPSSHSFPFSVSELIEFHLPLCKSALLQKDLEPAPSMLNRALHLCSICL